MNPIAKESDVCFLLEGTYPYLSGGVSTWVHDFICDSPDLRFSIFFIGSRREDFPELKYDIPRNVTRFSEIFLFDGPHSRGPDPHRVPPGIRKEYPLSAAHSARAFLDHLGSADRGARLLGLLLEMNEDMRRFSSFDAWWDHPDTWSNLCDIYASMAPREPFGNFFWAARNIVGPIWKLLHAMEEIPGASIYHSLCTGYAGLIGALASREKGSPFLLSEHGIYARERLEELRKSSFLSPPRDLHPALSQEINFLEKLWAGFFDVIGEACYGAAGSVVSLFQRNAEIQMEQGSPTGRIRIIPNGIDPSLYDNLIAKRESRRSDKLVVGFFGRVVPIKDVKCLLRAARLVLTELPDVTFQITGPRNEDPAYYEECRALADQLEINDRVLFTGPKDRFDFFAEIDVMVLTSRSEGQPFAILESFAARIPVVSTDVGACADLIDNGESAGVVASIGNHGQIADGLLLLLKDPERRRRMGRAGRARVEQHYLKRDILREYHDLYSLLLRDHASPHPGTSSREALARNPY